MLAAAVAEAIKARGGSLAASIDAKELLSKIEKRIERGEKRADAISREVNLAVSRAERAEWVKNRAAGCAACCESVHKSCSVSASSAMMVTWQANSMVVAGHMGFWIFVACCLLD